MTWKVRFEFIILWFLRTPCRNMAFRGEPAQPTAHLSSHPSPALPTDPANKSIPWCFSCLGVGTQWAQPSKDGPWGKAPAAPWSRHKVSLGRQSQDPAIQSMAQKGRRVGKGSSGHIPLAPSNSSPHEEGLSQRRPRVRSRSEERPLFPESKSGNIELRANSLPGR